MKLISFFSRFTFICNLCFLLFVIFSVLQAAKPATGPTGTIVVVPFFKDLVIILGFSAIIINLLMCLAYLVFFAFRKIIVLPRWLTIVNIIFLIPQFYYFFFYK